jgi:hypothetical protein
MTPPPGKKAIPNGPQQNPVVGKLSANILRPNPSVTAAAVKVGTAFAVLQQLRMTKTARLSRLMNDQSRLSISTPHGEILNELFRYTYKRSIKQASAKKSMNSTS